MWVAQQDPVPKHVTLYTDSLFDLFALRKQLHDPYSQRFHLHLPLLVDTKAAITSLVMQGTSLHFRKVKSHIGIIGNQYADDLAKKAANITFAEPDMPGTPTRRNARKRKRTNCVVPL
jgi:ribonuclease HI